MRILRPHWFSTMWLALSLAIAGCGGGGGGGSGGGAGDGKEGPGPVDPKPLVELVSIEVTPADSSLPKGMSQQYTATAVYSDSTVRDVTSDVNWSSGDAATASIDASGMVKGEAAGGPVDISASLDGVTGKTGVTISNARLSAIDVTPASASVPAGLTQKFVATGTYSDGSTLDISDQVEWQSSDDAVATVDVNGLATSAVADPGITVTATLDTVSDSASLTVTDATLQSIEVTPSAYSLAAGYEKDYAATGKYSDGSTKSLTASADWSSSDTTVADVTTTGKVKALKKGSSTIAAAFDGISGSNDVTVTDAELVSIAVSASSASLAAGYSQTYAAQGTYSDGSSQDLSRQVAWSVSDETLVRISNEADHQGEATALAVGGPLDVVATSGSIVGKAELSITTAVLVSIEVSAEATQIPAGLDESFIATGIYSDGGRVDLSNQVTWSSSDALVAKVSNAVGSKGLVSALADGATSIGAALDSVSGSLSLTVSSAVLQSIEVQAASDSLASGSQQQYSATGLYSDGSTLDLTGVVTWSSSDDAVAEISNAAGSKGLASAKSAGGPISIGASYDPGPGAVSDTRPLTVTAATLVQIVVSADSETLFKGLKQQYTAIGVYSDNSETDITSFVSWSVSAAGSTTVASINGSGLLTALAAGGPVNVGATLGAISGSTSLTVGSEQLSTLTLVPKAHQLPLGLTVQYQAIGTYTDDTELDLTSDVIWSSSNAAIASISNADGSQGLASGVSIGGPVTISARMADGTTASTTLSVTDAVLQSLVISPANLDLPRGVSQQYVATATFSDASVQDVTHAVVWSSSDPSVATISNADGSQGLAKTLTSSGPITISASLAAFTSTPATTSLTVNNLLLSSLEIRPGDDFTCGRTRSVQLSAWVVYNDGTAQNLTTQARWTSSDTRLFSVYQGLAKATGNPNRLGLATISATLQGLTATADLTKVKAKTACEAAD